MILSDVNQITPLWLGDRLQQNGYLSQATVTHVQVETSTPPITLKITYSPETSKNPPRSLILKFNDHKLGAYYEHLFYDKIAPSMTDPPVPECFDRAIDQNTGRGYILLEDLKPTHFVGKPNRLTKAQFESLVNVLLDYHVHWWEHPRITQKDFIRPEGGFGGMNAATSREVIQRSCRRFFSQDWPNFINEIGPSLRRDWKQIIERTISKWENLFIQRIGNNKGLTLVHGDAHLQNFLLPEAPSEDRAILVDWAGFARGVGPLDIAKMLIMCKLPSTLRKELESSLLTQYHTQLVERGIEGYSFDDCCYDYRLSVIGHIWAPVQRKHLPDLQATMDAFQDWDCEELLK